MYILLLLTKTQELSRTALVAELWSSMKGVKVGGQ